MYLTLPSRGITRTIVCKSLVRVRLRVRVSTTDATWWRARKNTTVSSAKSKVVSMQSPPSHPHSADEHSSSQKPLAKRILHMFSWGHAPSLSTQSKPSNRWRSLVQSKSQMPFQKDPEQNPGVRSIPRIAGQRKGGGKTL